MASKKKVIAISIIAFVVILIIIAVIMFIRSRDKDKKQEGDPLSKLPALIPPSITSIFTGGSSASESWPLKNGSRGNSVKQLQAAANKKCNSGLKEDGVWGPKSDSAFKSCLGQTSFTQADYARITGNAAPGTGTDAGTTPVSGSDIGKNVYAAFDGVQLYSDTKLTPLMKVNKGEWIGILTSKIALGSSTDPSWYWASGRLVPRAAVVLK